MSKAKRSKVAGWLLAPFRALHDNVQDAQGAAIVFVAAMFSRFYYDGNGDQAADYIGKAKEATAAMMAHVRDEALATAEKLRADVKRINFTADGRKAWRKQTGEIRALLADVEGFQNYASKFKSIVEAWEAGKVPTALIDDVEAGKRGAFAAALAMAKGKKGTGKRNAAEYKASFTKLLKSMAKDLDAKVTRKILTDSIQEVAADFPLLASTLGKVVK